MDMRMAGVAEPTETIDPRHVATCWHWFGCRIKHYWENWWFLTALLVIHNIHATVIPSLYPLTLSLGKGPPSLAWIAGSWKTRGESEWRRGPAPTIHRVITCICVRIKIEQMTTNYNLLYKRFIFVFLYLWENQDWEEDQCLDNNIFLAATTLTILIIFIHPSTLLAPWFRSYLIFIRSYPDWGTFKDEIITCTSWRLILPSLAYLRHKYMNW